MSIGNLRSIQTPAGVVEIGDTIEFDASEDPLERNYGWPKTITGKVFGCHTDHLCVDADVPIPGHLKTPIPPSGFTWKLSKENAVQVKKIVKGVDP